MGVLELLLIALLVLVVVGALGYGDGGYRAPGLGLGGVLLVVLLVLLLT